MISSTPEIVRARNYQPSHLDLPERTQHVRVTGGLTEGLYREILAQAPNIRTLTLTPSCLKHLSPGIAHDIAKKNISLHAESIPLIEDLTDNPAKKRDFLARRRALESMPDAAKQALARLLAQGCCGAEMLVKYYGLHGHKPTAQRQLTSHYGYPSPPYVSCEIGAVFLCLNPGTPANKAIQKRAQQLRDDYLVDDLTPLYAQANMLREELRARFGHPNKK